MTPPGGAFADAAAHWDGVYTGHESEQLSWFQRDPAASRRLITAFAEPSSAVLDVGAGDSRLVDALLDEGFTDLTLLDLSRVALARVERRLGARDGVTFVVDDVLKWTAPRLYDVWHDRAVFHFLADPADQRRYVAAVEGALAPDGAVVLATFDVDGPATCSGLSVTRHGAADLAELFAPAWVVAASEREVHHTPSGEAQSFTWVVLRRR